MFRRISAISFTYAGVLALNTLDIQSIGSGIGLYSGLFKISFLSNFIAVFILLISSIIILIWPGVQPTPASSQAIAYNHIENESKSNEYCLIVLFNILGALFLISSLDLISMYLSIELQSFGLYILATLYKEKYSSTSAGLKYFLLGGLSSCIILLGCGIIYSYIGLTNLESIYAMISVYFFNYPSLVFAQHSPCVAAAGAAAGSALGLEQAMTYNLDLFRGISLGFILIFAGFLFKIAASPFHNWAPDVYDDSPTLVTTWLTIMPKISILILLLELMIYSAGAPQIGDTANAVVSAGTLADGLQAAAGIKVGVASLPLAGRLDLLEILTNLLILSSLLSLIIGSIVGLSQIRIKRLLAYSTISHIGFLLLALSIFSKSSIEAFIFYIIQYSITNLDIFLILLAFGYIFKVKQTKVPSNPLKQIKINLTDVEYINNLKGIFYKNPLLSISFSICLFSFAGVPPLIGFFAKQQILYSSNSAGFYFLSVIAILVSVISASYYLKIIKVLHSYPNNFTTGLGLSESLKEPVQRYPGNYNYFTSIHAFIIGILTLSIILFIFNPELIQNCITIITNLILNI